MSSYKMDAEDFGIEDDTEDTIYPLSENHCPMFRTPVTSETENSSDFENEIFSPKMQEADDRSLTGSLIRPGELGDPEVRSLDVLIEGGTTDEFKVTSECVDLGTPIEESFRDGGESTKYADHKDRVIDLWENGKGVAGGSGSHSPFKVGLGSTNARQSFFDFPRESMSRTQNITVPSGLTELEIEHLNRGSLTDGVQVKYRLANLVMLARRTGQLDCDNCKKWFARKSLLIRHMKRHEENKNECQTCRRIFNSKRRLTNHMLIHTRQKSHKCQICEKTFAFKSYLNNHMVSHTKEKCHICNKQFSSKSYLNNHIVSHTGEKLHACHICDKTFTLKHNLRTHMRAHNRGGPYNCQFCEETFAQKTILKSHLLIHNEERLNECRICGKNFAPTTNLKLHMLIHNGEKPHECQICEKTFTQKGHLKQHMQTHTRKKPH